MTNKIDYDLTAQLSMEITQRVKRILKDFPVANEELLKHLAAANIHLAFFMRDILDYKKGTKTTVGYEEKFLDECGCKDV